MRKRGIPEEYVEWLKRRLGNRRTTLSFDDYKTEIFIVLNGLDQGDLSVFKVSTKIPALPFLRILLPARYPPPEDSRSRHVLSLMASQHPIRRADLLDGSIAWCCFHIKFLSFYLWGNKAHSLRYFCLDQRIHSRPFYASARILILSSKKQSHNTRVVNTASAKKK
jgi:hypothetical protein